MVRRDLTFRVFVSSTFSDLKAERNALQENAFPRLRAYCQEKGARFQAIDLRWGVSEEAALDQQTMNICLQELKRCQTVSPRPNFIILLGERYGWRPLPPQIEASEFDTLLKHVPTNQRPLLLEWYKRDDNAITPEYCLQPREVDVGDSQTDQEKQAAHDAEARRWTGQTEPLLHSLLIRAARRVFPDSEDPRRQKYEDSATHQEIRYGAFKAEDPQSHVLAYFRTIERLPKDDRAKDFLDIKDGTIDGEAQARLQSLKEELRGLLPHEHAYECKAQWHDGQPQSDLEALCDRVENDLRAVIDSELAAFQRAPELEREIKAHQEFGQQRAEHFIGRQEVLEKIQTYLLDENNRPLVIHGVSGSGKTALMARVVQTTKEAFPDTGTIFRFIGATPSSSDGRSLLESLCHQIYETFNLEEQKHNLLAQIKDTGEEGQKGRQRIEEEYSVPSEYQKLSTTFRDFLTKIPKARKLILFLDALDQLSDTDHARSLSWLPDKLPENVRLIVSCLPGECLSILQKRLPQQNIVELKPMPPEEGEKLLDIWLHDASRTLQRNQRSEVLGKFQQCGLPLYLKLAFEESRLWKSYTEKVELSPDIPDIIRDLLRRLSLEANHGQMMVSRSLGYVAAAKNGLTEDELLDVLPLDKEVVSDFLRRSAKSPPVERLPVVVWSRLYFDLKPYLTERTADGTTLMTFYHPQFGKVIAAEFLAGEIEKKRHQGLAEYFAEQSLWTEKDKKKNPNLRKVSELPYQQTNGELWDEVEKTLCDLHFIEAKCAGGMTYDLIRDYNNALDSLPEAQPEKQEILEHEARLKKYTEDLIAYAKGEIDHLDIIPSVEPWSDEKIRQDSERIINNPTRLDRIRAFSQFVNSESHDLLQCVSLSAFCFQHSFNFAASGPLAKAAESIIKAGEDRVLLLQFPSYRSDYNPHPALLRTLEGHKFGITSVGMTYNAKTAVSSSSDKTLRVWDLENGECLRTLPGHAHLVSCVSITPDGKKAVSSSFDKTLRVWDLESGECLRTLHGHMDAILCVSVTPDGKKAISGSEDNTLRVWNLESGECLRTLHGHMDAILCVSVTPDGKKAISGSEDNTLRVWNLESWTCLGVLKGHIDRIEGVSITPDGKKAVSSSFDKTLRVWDLENGECLRTPPGHAGEIDSVSITPDGKRAVSGSRDRTVRMWDIENGESFRVNKSHSSAAICVITTPDWKRAISASWDHSIRVWELGSRERFRILNGHTGWVTGVSITRDGKVIVSGGLDQTLRVWNIDSGECLRIFRGHSDGVRCVCISPDGEKVLSGGSQYDQTLRVWDLMAGECLKILKGHAGWIKSVNVTPDGKRAITGGLDRTIRIWDIYSGHCLGEMQGHEGFVLSVNITPNGRRVVSGSEDGTIRVWDLVKMVCNRIIKGHNHYVSSVVVSPDGRSVLSGSWDRSLRLWDITSGECIAFHRGKNNIASISAIRADGCFVFSTMGGNINYIAPRNFPVNHPIVTPVRFRLYEEAGNFGLWDDNITTLCQWCGQRFPVSDKILNVIRAINRNANLTPEESPCLELPDEAWEEPRLLSECPLCHKPLKFNPFIVDNREKTGYTK